MNPRDVMVEIVLRGKMQAAVLAEVLARAREVNVLHVLLHVALVGVDATAQEAPVPPVRRRLDVLAKIHVGEVD